VSIFFRAASMFRAGRLIRLVSPELKEKFVSTTFASSKEMLAAYKALTAPIEKLRESGAELGKEHVRLEQSFMYTKDLTGEQKAQLDQKMKENAAKVQKLRDDILKMGQTLDTRVYEKALGQLAKELPADALSAAEAIGVEMNDLKIPTSPAVMAALRTIYFGDSGETNSELLFRFVENPASMFVLTGDVPDMIKKIPELFDERGSTAIDHRPLDRQRFEQLNEVDNERKLLAQLAAQK